MKMRRAGATIRRHQWLSTKWKTFQLIPKAKGAEAAKALRNRERIIVEKAADEFDEIAVAFERDLASSK